MRFFLFLFIFPAAVLGGNEVRATFLRGEDVRAQAKMTIFAEETAYYGWQICNSSAKVCLYLAEDRKKLRTTPTEYVVQFLATCTTRGGITNTFYDTLSVRFEPFDAYKDVDFVKYNNCQRVELTILGTNQPFAEDIVLSLELTTVRAAANVALPSQTNWVYGYEDVAKNELQLSWLYIPGADSYDVEWLFIDNPENSHLHVPYDFANATRVNVSENFYAIPLNYPRGNILFRVRGVGKYYELRKFYPIYGAWSLPIERDSVLPAPNFHQHLLYDGLEQALNWQAVTTFSEEGKRRERLDFFDGTLRRRQSVTNNNSTGAALVSETFYDHVGRAALQSIPVPTPSWGLRYYGEDGTSLGNFSGGLDKVDFDTDSALLHAPKLAVTAGSARYFSPDNPFLDELHWQNLGALPRDSGYTYSQTRFLNDGSDRVLAQSRAGQGFQHGSGKEIKRFYGQPMQVELDRLFGNEAGFANHYQKVLTKDENGQISVAYYDMKERVIATGIAGSGAENLLEIDDAPPAEKLHNEVQFDSASRRWVHNLVVATPANWNFQYYFNAPNCFADTCENVRACTDCRYKLVLSLWDFETQNYIFYDSLIVDEELILRHNLSLTPGSYQLYKNVQLLEDEEFSTQVEAFGERHRACVNYPRAEVATCYTPCQEWAMDSCGISAPDSANSLYLQLVEICENPPQSPPTDCDLKLQMLLQDMSPGGQYFDNIRTACPGDTAFQQPSNRNDYLSTICPERFKRDPQITALRLSFGCTEFNDIFWDTLRTHWQPEFAFIMLRYHPEYQLYTMFCDCGNVPAQRAYDSIMFNTNTFAEAVATGLWNPLDMNVDSINGIHAAQLSGYQPFTTANLDPFFNLSDGCCAEATEEMVHFMRKKLSDYMLWNVGDSTFAISLWYLLFDPHGIADGATLPYSDSIFSAIAAMQNVIVPQWAQQYSCSKEDARWRIFKSSYLYLKNEAKIRFLRTCAAPDCDATQSLFHANHTLPPNCCNNPPFSWGQAAWWERTFQPAEFDYCDIFLKADTNCPTIPITVGNGRGGFQIRFLCDPMYGVNSDNWAEILQNGLASDSVNDLIQSELPFIEHDYYAECVLEAQLAAAAQDSTAFQRAWDSLKVDFRHNFIKHCEHIKELLTIDCEQSEFLYTLYYYDQADNLIRTVPPAGVDVIQNQTTLENIAQYRYNISRYDTLLLGHTIPEHKMVTNFRYNTRNQIVQRYQPDHDSVTVQFYDRLARPILSQNAKQQLQNHFSYIFYDKLGRVTQTGQVRNSTPFTKEDLHDPNFFQHFVNDSTCWETTYIFYDSAKSYLQSSANMRNRVAAIMNPFGYNSTFYTYDWHGNVRQILQYYEPLFTFSRDFIRINYDYDLISGRVKRSWYQRGKPEALMHRYRYDADLRLTHVFTASNGGKERLEARYLYYPHGTLARVLLGDKQPQQIDYAYTLHGWLKQKSARAATSTLHYFHNDYEPIGNAAPTWQDEANGFDLFNGNISCSFLETKHAPLLQKMYRYDQLNRLKVLHTAKERDGTFESLTPRFGAEYSYDFNGNLMQLRRYNDHAQLWHEINYKYNYSEHAQEHPSNRLDAISTQGMPPSDFHYDAIGNLIEDEGEGITISWTAANKIKRIETPNAVITYFYDATGQRFFKRVARLDVGDTLRYFYMRDAVGNLLCLYEQRGNELIAIERPIYGIERLGVLKHETVIRRYPFSTDVPPLTAGLRHYEHTDHLGNVVAVCSDRHFQTNDDTEIDCRFSADYYPFGLLVPTRYYPDIPYRYGFNGQEKEDEVYGEGTLLGFEYRQYDSRIGRFWSVDPLSEEYPGWTPYGFSANNPIIFIDEFGKKVKPMNEDALEIIRLSLSPKESEYVKIENDFISVQALEEGIANLKIVGENFSSLLVLTKAEDIIEVSTSELLNYLDEQGVAAVKEYNLNKRNLIEQTWINMGGKIDINSNIKIDDMTYSDFIKMNEGHYYIENVEEIAGATGETLLPIGSEKNPAKRYSTNSNIQVFVNSKANKKVKVKSLAHELYGHVLFKILNKFPFHGKSRFPDVDGANTELELQINQAINEAELNYEKHFK